MYPGTPQLLGAFISALLTDAVLSTVTSTAPASASGLIASALAALGGAQSLSAISGVTLEVPR